MRYRDRVVKGDGAVQVLHQPKPQRFGRATPAAAMSPSPASTLRRGGSPSQTQQAALGAAMDALAAESVLDDELPELAAARTLPLISLRPYYTAIFLTHTSADALMIAVGGARFPQLRGDHVTLKFRPSKQDIHATPIGERVVIGVVPSRERYDNRVQAVEVVLSSSMDLLCSNDRPHCTISVAHGFSAVHSNDMLHVADGGTAKPRPLTSDEGLEMIRLNGVVGLVVEAEGQIPSAGGYGADGRTSPRAGSGVGAAPMLARMIMTAPRQVKSSLLKYDTHTADGEPVVHKSAAASQLLGTLGLGPVARPPSWNSARKATVMRNKRKERSSTGQRGRSRNQKQVAVKPRLALSASKTVGAWVAPGHSGDGAGAAGTGQWTQENQGKNLLAHLTSPRARRDSRASAATNGMPEGSPRSQRSLSSSPRVQRTAPAPAPGPAPAPARRMSMRDRAEAAARSAVLEAERLDLLEEQRLDAVGSDSDDVSPSGSSTNADGGGESDGGDAGGEEASVLRLTIADVKLVKSHGEKAFSDALHHLMEEMHASEDEHGADHIDTKIRTNNAAMLFYEAGQIGHAAEMFLALGVDARPPPPVPMTNKALHELIEQSHEDAAQAGEEHHLLEDTLDDARADLRLRLALNGAGSEEVAYAAANVAKLCKTLEQSEEAVPLFRRVMAWCREHRPAGAFTAGIVHDFAAALHDVGEIEEAFPLYEEALAGLRKVRAWVCAEHAQRSAVRRRRRALGRRRCSDAEARPFPSRRVSAHPSLVLTARPTAPRRVCSAQGRDPRRVRHGARAARDGARRRSD